MNVWGYTFDILAISETHLDRKISNRQLEIDNYKIIRRNRDVNTTGGGCLFDIANHICSTRPSSLKLLDIEAMWLRILVNSSVFIVWTVYRPPSDSLFVDRFQVIFRKLWIKRRNVVIYTAIVLVWPTVLFALLLAKNYRICCLNLSTW